MTDRGLDACVTAQQVFGGHGYIREWGMEQLVRDVRIAQIYEGTNGIQAADFMLRKVASDQGTVLFDLIREFSADLAGSASTQIKAATERFESATQSLLERGKTQPELLAWVANDYLDLTGYLLYAFMWDKMEAALDTAKHSEDFIHSKQLKAKFYYSRVLPRIESLFSLIE